MSAVPAQAQLTLPSVTAPEEIGLSAGGEAKAMADVDDDAGSAFGIPRPGMIAQSERLSAEAEVDRIVARHVFNRIQSCVRLNGDSASADQPAEASAGAALQAGKRVEA